MFITRKFAVALVFGSFFSVLTGCAGSDPSVGATTATDTVTPEELKVRLELGEKLLDIVSMNDAPTAAQKKTDSSASASSIADVLLDRANGPTLALPEVDSNDGPLAIAAARRDRGRPATSAQPKVDSNDGPWAIADVLARGDLPTSAEPKVDSEDSPLALADVVNGACEARDADATQALTAVRYSARKTCGTIGNGTEIDWFTIDARVGAPSPRLTAVGQLAYDVWQRQADGSYVCVSEHAAKTPAPIAPFSGEYLIAVYGVDGATGAYTLRGQ